MARIPFTPADEQNIGAMAKYMSLAGILGIVGAVLGVIGSIIQGVAAGGGAGMLVGNICGGVLRAGIAGALAMLLLQASKAFKQVVDTDHSDQALLVDGMTKLRNYFLLKGVLVILGIVLACCVGVIGGVVAASAMR